MHKIIRKEDGFSHLIIAVAIVVVAAVGSTGYLVYKDHSKKTVLNTASVSANTPTTTKATTSTSATSTISQNGSSNAELESQLNSVNSLNAQSSQQLSASNSALNDKSTFTSY